MSTPASAAASKMRVPFATASASPSTVTFTVSTAPVGSATCSPLLAAAAASDGRQGAGFHQRQVVAAELLDGRHAGGGRRVAQHADGLARHVVRNLQQGVQVVGRAAAVLDPAQDLGGPGGALAAGR